jgi:quercetin dioxygenase-like cupin family protein
MLMKRRLIAAVVGATALVSGAAVAVATPGSGIIEAPILARGSFTDEVGIKFGVRNPGGKNEIIQVADPSETVVQRILVGPGGQTGWHSHPGPALVVVESGELTLYRAHDPTCRAHPYGPGEAFLDPGRGNVHIGRNLSSDENVLLYVTYFDVPSGGSPRIDSPDPGNCSF